MIVKAAGRRRPTLEVVAERAGVSRATVSRVVNGSPSVNAGIRDAVLAAVAELGYVPNRLARGLVTQRTDAYALVLTESAGQAFADDPFFATLVRGAMRELDAAGKELVLQMVTSEQSRDRIRAYAVGGHVDGVMAVSTRGAAGMPAALARMGVPVVVNGRPIGRSSVPYVDVANVAGARRAVEQLLGSGRRRIATIAGPQNSGGGIDRLAGYRDALREAKHPPLVQVGDFTHDSGRAAMAKLLADDPRLDAVFVASDLMANGALRTLREAGRRVPDDVAVIGFDDTDLARYAEPALTTVRLPIQDIGRTMARQILRLADGETVERSIVLNTELTMRATT
jgi:DNA-binding LacI/PurR family transcriptional regulator